MGGLSKKAFQIQNLRTKNSLLLDAGNLLFKQPVVAPGPNQARLTAQSITDIYGELHFDAVGVGPLDLGAGYELLRHQGEQGFPWISANLFDPEGKPLFPQWVRKKLGKTEIVITALTAPPGQPLENVTVQPWESTLPQLLQQIKAEVGNPFIILLSNLPDQKNRLIAEKHGDIHLVIGGDPLKGNSRPLIVKQALLTQTSDQGKYQGLLEITLGSKRQWGRDEARDLADLQNRLGSLNWQLRRLEKKAALPAGGDRYSASISRLKKEREELQASIVSTEERVEREKTVGPGNDQYSYRFIALEKNKANDGDTKKRLNRLKQEIRDLHEEKKAAILKSSPAGPASPQPGMLGNNACETCHPIQTEFWRSTGHAQAYTTLARKEKNLDLNCLPCHVTRDLQNPDHDKLSATTLLSFPVEFQSVGCESCHGAAGPHGENPEQVKLVRRPDEAVCLTCHTEEHDDNFNYESKLTEVACPAG